MADEEDIARAQRELEQRRADLAAKEAEKARKRPPASTVGDALAGAAKPTKGEIRGYAALIAALTSRDPAVKRRARFAIAEDVRRNLHRHKRRDLPSMPVRLPPESVLLQILKKRGKARGAGDRGTVMLFVRWRDAVYKAEHANESTLRALFDAVTTFRDFELPDFAAEVLAHLEHEFDVLEVPGDPREWQLDGLTRDHRLLTPALRRGERSRRRRPVEHPEDDDSALRGDIRIPEPGTKPDDFDPDDDFDLPDFP